MGPASSEKGFSLLEFVAVLALVGGVLLTLTQLRGVQTQQRLHYALLDTIEYTRAALYEYFSQHNKFPVAISALQLPEPPLTPWGESFELRHQGKQVSIVVPTANDTTGAWLQARLPMTIQEPKRLLIHVPTPIQQLTADLALHRVEVIGRPELNAMQTNLNMNGFNVLNFGYIDAHTGSINQVTTDTANFGTLTADAIWVSNQLTAAQADMGVLTINTAAINLLNVQQADFDSLQVNTLSTDVFNSNQLTTGSLSVSSLTAGSITTEQLTVGEITAADFVTSIGSFNETHQRLQALELIWLQCVATGGCR